MDPLLISIPIAGALLIVGWLSLRFARRWLAEWRRRRAQERAKREREQALLAAAQAAQPPEGSFTVNTGGRFDHEPDQSGRLMLILIGTFADEVGGEALDLLTRCELDGAVGSVLALEADARRRQRFLDRLPAGLRDRVCAPEFPGIAGGFGNAGPDTVRARIDIWGPVVIAAAKRTCELHRRLNGGAEAALGLVFVSLGGSAIIGATAVETIAAEFRLASFYGFTALPVDDVLRDRVPRIFAGYHDAGVKGFVFSDNLVNEVANDLGMVAAIVGFGAAAETADAVVEANNAWYLLFGEQPGGLVSYATWAGAVPGYEVTPTHPAVPSRSYVPKPAVAAAILTGLDEVDRPEHHALGSLGFGEPAAGTSRVEVVLAAVDPADLKDLEDDIVLGRQLRLQDKRNHHLLFAPIATEVDPEQIRVPVAVVALQAIRDPDAFLARLTAPAAALPEPAGNRPAIPADFTPSTVMTTARESDARDLSPTYHDQHEPAR